MGRARTRGERQLSCLRELETRVRALCVAARWFLILALGLACTSDALLAGDEPPRRRIVILGDSLTAGFGVDPSEAYPALVQKRIDSLGLPFVVVNAGVSGDTTSGGLRRIDWVLKQPVDVFVLALGGNDGLRGISPPLTRSNLMAILDKVVARNPQAALVLAGMQMPPNMGPDYTREFQALFPEVARAKAATLIPFLLEGVGGKPEMNQPDQIHPTPEGHAILSQTVLQTLLPILKSRSTTAPAGAAKPTSQAPRTP